MLIVALVMAVIGLAALVTAVVTGNQVIAWVCIGASVIGVVLLIIDALRERQRRDATPSAESAEEEEPAEEVEEEASVEDQEFDVEYPEEEAEPESVEEKPTER